MINLGINFSNPWCRRWIIVSSKAWVPKDKAVAFEFNTYKSNTVLNLEFGLNIRCDHAGVRLQAGLLGYEVEFYIYDTRHWDYIEGKKS